MTVLKDLFGRHKRGGRTRCPPPALSLNEDKLNPNPQLHEYVKSRYRRVNMNELD